MVIIREIVLRLEESPKGLTPGNLEIEGYIDSG